MRWTCGLTLLLALLLVAPALLAAHEGVHEDAQQAPPPGGPTPAVGVTEHLGQYVPAEVVLRDEQGQPVNLRQLLKVPTVLVPVYYSCPYVCNLLLGQLSQTLPQVGLQAGRDYQVISVSFDERETPEVATRKRRDYTMAAGPKVPPEAWRFLTGDKANIDLLMQSIGYRFQRQGNDFQHPMAMVALSPSGKITRYIYGGSPLPFDIAMATLEAAGEQPGLSITRALSYCFTYDQSGQRYVFNLMRVAGVGVLLAVALFAGFLIAGSRQRARRQAARRGQEKA